MAFLCVVIVKLLRLMSKLYCCFAVVVGITEVDGVSFLVWRYCCNNSCNYYCCFRAVFFFSFFFFVIVIWKLRIYSYNFVLRISEVLVLIIKDFLYLSRHVLFFSGGGMLCSCINQ